MLQVPPSFDVTNKTDGSSFTTRWRRRGALALDQAQHAAASWASCRHATRSCRARRTSSARRTTRSGAARGAGAEFLRSIPAAARRRGVGRGLREAPSRSPARFPVRSTSRRWPPRSAGAASWSAAVCFPPDLGQGVNAALEDVKTLGDVLDDQNAARVPGGAGAGREGGRAPRPAGLPVPARPVGLAQRLFTVGSSGASPRTPRGSSCPRSPRK